MSRTFLDDSFLLRSETAEQLFYGTAATLPIIDYHTHLPPREVAENRRWEDLTALWLGEDHYKWRAMRANGIPESHITGAASPREKFQAWAETVPHTLGNPLYHWTHLELKRAFHIDALLGPDTAEEIWNAGNERLGDQYFSAQGLLHQFGVDTVGTTDDPSDPLVYHEICATLDIGSKIYPTYRPDKALMVDRPHILNPFCDQLGEVTGIEITTLTHLLEALKKRHDEFHAVGCRLSDHGLKYCPAEPCPEKHASAIFHNARSGLDVDPGDVDEFAAFLMLHFGRWNAERDWTMQLHLAPVRNPNSRSFARLGPDSGFDTIGDWPQGESLLAFLDLLDREKALPKTILYNLNPRDNALFAAACGSFQEGPTPAKIQWGSAWWYNDTLRGMTDQIQTLAEIGLLSRFVGMLTDSRSFLSYPRHEYFRRLLCNLIATDVENGEIPNDPSLLDSLIRAICYENAKAYFKFPHLMSRKHPFTLLTILGLGSGLLALPSAGEARPNILWLTAEDHGPHLGCYGDRYADTPNLDAFAKKSLRYLNAVSTAPVCAPARTTIITGMYAPSLGAHHMRSQAPRPAWLKFYPEFLREAGYYCTNNSKTDYNIDHDIKAIWDESSGKAHYTNRPAGKPFFAIFNQTCTHESKIRNPNAKPTHDPARAPLPPYHPDTPEVRSNWAQYYDRLTQMDTWFAGHLEALEQAGLAQDTVVMFWADHGSGMPRGKRYAGWSGLHVPMIVHIPEKWKHLRPPEYQAGGTSDRMVGFVDLGATTLSLAGIKPAEFQQGHAFLGKFVSDPPKFSFGFRGRMDERPDSSRTVMDGHYVYIRNFMPHLPHGQSLHYQLQTQTTRIWRRLYREGKLNQVQAAFWKAKKPEELYDIIKDPHETVNLAASEDHAAQLNKMRAALRAQMLSTRDIGLFPEGMFHDEAERHGVTPGDLVRNDEFYPMNEIFDSADLLLAPTVQPENIVPSLSSKNAARRYWGVLACLFKGRDTTIYLAPRLSKLLKDPSPSVRIAAAEALSTHILDEDDPETEFMAHSGTLYADADPTLTSAYHAVAALNALEHLLPNLNEKDKARIAKLPTKDPDAPGRANGYAERMHRHIANPIPD